MHITTHEVMKTKIFISTELYWGNATGNLSGYVKQTKECLTFYILRIGSNLIGKSQIIGEICVDLSEENLKNNFVQFARGQDNIQLNKICSDGYLDVDTESIQIILYDRNKWIQVSKESADIETDDCIECFSSFIQGDLMEKQPITERSYNPKDVKIITVFLRPLLGLVNKLTKELTVAKHMSDWYQCLQNELNIRQKLWTIALNVLAGLIILIWLIYLGKPGQYFMQFTEFVVHNVRVLLNSLKGSPVGLKLNVELNNFFLNCFAYHVDLWATFLVIVSPVVQYLFIPLAIIGCLGLSFQLALLSDLLILISVHAHCFYIYAAVLYHIEIVGISALWRVLLGKRNNILKNRIESHDYSNPQLYLATMFFATLLFILPTVLVYYIVFASLRFCVYSITYILAIMQRQILLFPTYDYVKWLTGSYANHDNIEISLVKVKLTKTKNVSYVVSVIYIEPKASILLIKSASKVKLNSDSLMSIDQFLLSLVRSDLLGFIHPRKKL